jgi:serine/threonine protein kinase
MPGTWVRPQQKPDPNAIPFYLGKREHHAQDESGRVLAGRYELLEVLASGGTAVVYTAVDRTTGGSVAVKVLYETAREVVGAFFGQEGRLAARVQSPHLVHARQFGEEDGRLFIVFDLVAGEALPDMYFHELMPWRELCAVVLQVLAGLDALHQGGIVHRDVKPDNIIVKRTLGDEVHVTLLDLGFAWVPPARNLTGAPEPTRQVFGTDGFIAPELLGGGLPEPRNDLYSVGALMYMMLTAQRVPDLSPAPELMEIPPPRAFVPGLPQRVDDIVMRALSDVEARFQSAEEMATAIRAALNEEAAASRVSAKPDLRDDEAPTMPRAMPAASISRATTSFVTSPPNMDPAEAPAHAGASTSRMGPPSPAAPTSRLWVVAAALLVGAVAGSTAVQLADGGTRADSIAAQHIAADDRPDDEARRPTAPDSTPGPLDKRARPEPASFVTPAAGPSTEGSASSPALPAATGKVRVEGARPTATSPSSGRAQTFKKVMARLEPGIRDCITRMSGKAPAKEAEVHVRFDPASGAIDQVRVLNLGSANPIARCIDEAVRRAAPPSGGRPNETFTFFRFPGAAPS